MVEFCENAGFNFILKAEGQKDINISVNGYPGSTSQGDGRFQAFYVKLNDSQLGQIAAGVPYRLEPLNKSNEYFWIVNDGVTLTKTGSIDTLDVLNSTILTDTVSFNDCDIRIVTTLLEDKISKMELSGEMDKVEFVILVKNEELRQSPKITFSAEGLTIAEILWIACNRSHLDYRVKGNTVHIDKKK
ncbi:MAG: hypothetical protein ACYTE8_04495 [Planctomycetota bacterium]